VRLLNREMQRELLVRMGGRYPSAVDFLGHRGDISIEEVLVNLNYLSEHELAASETVRFVDGSLATLSGKITAKGLDFLADDGGLGAILGVVSVRLHQDTVRDLLLARIESADADDSVKAQLARQVKALPATAMQRVAEAAIDAGLRQLPNVVQWVQVALAAP